MKYAPYEVLQNIDIFVLIYQVVSTDFKILQAFDLSLLQILSQTQHMLDPIPRQQRLVATSCLAAKPKVRFYLYHLRQLIGTLRWCGIHLRNPYAVL